MNNAQRFLDAYAVIEHALAVIVNDYRYVPFHILDFFRIFLNSLKNLFNWSR